MFLDFHTHTRSVAPDVQCILNVRYPGEIGDGGPVSLGIHPYDAGDEAVDWFDVEAKMALPEVRVIGEAGLDVLHGGKQQEEFFLKQINIAERCRKPMVIHCVKAFNELIAMRRLLRPRQAWAVHGFNRKPELAEELIKRGFYLSFGKSLLDKSTVQESLAVCPLDRLFLETDDAQDVSIQEIYTKASQIKGRAIEDLKLDIQRNFYERFVVAVPV